MGSTGERIRANSSPLKKSPRLTEYSLEIVLPDLLGQQSPRLAPGIEEPIFISDFPTHKTLSETPLR